MPLGPVDPLPNHLFWECWGGGLGLWGGQGRAQGGQWNESGRTGARVRDVPQECGDNEETGELESLRAGAVSLPQTGRAQALRSVFPFRLRAPSTLWDHLDLGWAWGSMVVFCPTLSSSMGLWGEVQSRGTPHSLSPNSDSICREQELGPEGFRSPE